MDTNLILEQGQQLTQQLSPRQVQYMRLLEMNSLELEKAVDSQLYENPALEAVEPVEAQTDRPDDTIAVVPDSADPEDDPADYVFPSNYTGKTPADIPVADDSIDIYSYLLDQLGQIDLPEKTARIARYIAGNIDDNGYLTRSFNAMADDISIATGDEVYRDDVAAAADIVRSLDPAGVGAVDLRDCLLLQIRRLQPVTFHTRIAKEIIADNFDLYSKKHFDRLQAQLGVSKEDMEEANRLIQSLNPKPGADISVSSGDIRMSHITPDVALDIDDGRFTVSLVSRLPQLQIERSFSIDEDDTDHGNHRLAAAKREGQKFIKSKRDDAEAFISALKQRSNTLLAVTEAIVNWQRDFFLTGDKARLKPMILKDIAKVTNLHESVVSRATSGKYIVTPSRLYPLKMFFNEAPKDGSDISSHQIMDVIRRIIDSEDKRHPLSDQAICDIMAQKGIDIARRTVLKYRKHMGLPDSRMRRQLK